MTNDELTETLLHLFEMKAITVSYDENLEPTFAISEVGKRLMEIWKEQA